MRFEHPELLWFLLLVLPALTGFFWWSWRKRRSLIAQFVQSRLLAHLTVGVSTRRQKLRMALVVAAVGLLLVVLARPQWGFHWEEARQRGLDIVIAIDTSRSMLAEDLAPNRLARAKLAALDLMKASRTDRIGLVAFAGSAFLQCPLSFDDEAFRQSVNALDVSIIPQGGTALAEAIECARAAFREKSDNHKVLVLFSDGEDHDGRALDAARAAAKDGLRIFTVGVGTANGELLRVADDKGRQDYIRDDQGNVVKSRLNEKLLQQLAQETHGFYMLLAGANTVELLYDRGLSPLPKGELSARRIKRFHERYQWFLGLVIGLLLLEMFLPERKRVQRNEAILAGSTNAELRKSVALLFLLLLPAATFGSAADALKQYRAGKYNSARREYEELLKKHPDDPRLNFNAGTAAYQAGNFEKALEHLNAAANTPDLPLQEGAYYNRGNAQFRLGEEASDFSAKSERWEQAISSYNSALNLNTNDLDARFNLELVKQKLEELKKQQQQQQQQQQQSKDDKKDQEKDRKNDQQKHDQKQDQQQQQQQQQQQDQAKPEESQKQDQQKQAAQNKDGKADEKSAANPMRAVQMTPQQAQQLLDAQKGEEKAMIFIPQQIRTNRTDRVFKNW